MVMTLILANEMRTQNKKDEQVVELQEGKGTILTQRVDGVALGSLLLRFWQDACHGRDHSPLLL